MTAKAVTLPTLRQSYPKFDLAKPGYAWKAHATPGHARSRQTPVGGLNPTIPIRILLLSATVSSTSHRAALHFTFPWFVDQIEPALDAVQPPTGVDFSRQSRAEVGLSTRPRPALAARRWAKPFRRSRAPDRRPGASCGPGSAPARNMFSFLATASDRRACDVDPRRRVRTWDQKNRPWPMKASPGFDNEAYRGLDGIRAGLPPNGICT